MWEDSLLCGHTLEKVEIKEGRKKGSNYETKKAPKPRYTNILGF